MRKIPWRQTLRAIAVLSWAVALLWLIYQPGFEPLLAFLAGAGMMIGSFVGEGRGSPRPGGETPTEVQVSTAGFRLYPATCGDKGLDLSQQRLMLTAAFGPYFAGLLERDNSYVPLDGQIDFPAAEHQIGLSPIERVFWALEHGAGPKILIIAAEGGMGKSTLAAKVVRCLFEQRAVDVILGDSAKTQRVDPLSGKVKPISPTYFDPSTFCEKLCVQLGMPVSRGGDFEKRALTDIRDRLEGRRAVIVIDNLESVVRGDELLGAIQKIAARDLRVIVTTRKASGLGLSSTHQLMITLKPVTDVAAAQAFLRWHIQHYGAEHRDLGRLESDFTDEKLVKRLTVGTGGIPLLMQLVVSDVARSSWACIDDLPHLFGGDLLGFLYQARWRELGRLGPEGSMAQQLLYLVAREQYRGKKVSFGGLMRWAQEQGIPTMLQDALRLLHERFLIINHDPKDGNFAVFPSLAEFLRAQPSRQ